jgi:hypothetical protein
MMRTAMKHAFAPLAALAAGLLMTAAAQAFTIEGGPGSADASSKWQDLDTAKPKADQPDSRFKSENGLTSFKSGNSTFYLGNERSFDNLFNPYARDGR